MTDIVEILRRSCAYQNPDRFARICASRATNGLVLDAADEIERLRVALEEIAWHDPQSPAAVCARQALGTE